MSIFMNPRKNKPLLAVMTGNAALLKDILEKGADPNLPGPQNTTALHMAVLLCHEEGVDLLINAGAKLEARDKNDLTPLGYAVLPVKETPLPLLKKQLKTEEGQALLEQSRFNIRKRLLAAGADWHARSKKAPTPWERFEHYWPEEDKLAIPVVGPAQV